ncbi:ABC transporter ATP-binding protein [Candidatus Saganbacteria bacterium]|nr:ABC transporter ATP-binding protein [Candidatus Saganbacteria bacterium]
MIKALLGPNGAGKSTYLRRLMGLDTGEVDRNAAMVFQEPLLFDLTVKENIALGLRFRRDREINRKVELWLMKMGIEPLGSRRALTLSGGEAQKAALARALAIEPKRLLLDEPFANLDLPSQIGLREELKAIIADKDIETIWVTHNKAEALAVADHLMIMMDFKVVQEGAPQAVVSNPNSVEVAAFLGVDNLFFGRVAAENGRRLFENQKVRFETAAEVKDRAWAVVHPEDIILSPEPLAGTSARNCLRGKVAEIIPLGLTYRLRIEAGEIFMVDITKVSAEELRISYGQELFLIFKATAVHII